jgi:hypothetical protein
MPTGRGTDHAIAGAESRGDERLVHRLGPRDGRPAGLVATPGVAAARH